MLKGFRQGDRLESPNSDLPTSDLTSGDLGLGWGLDWESGLSTLKGTSILFGLQIIAN